MTMRWKCDGQGCYLKTSLPDWAMLDGCFGKTTVNVSDVDGLVYQNGHLLWLEKKFPAGCISPPQMRAFLKCVANGDAVIVVWCERTDGADLCAMRVLGIDGYDPRLRMPANLDDFRAAVSQWWQSVYEPGKL